jgi:hypothetical protein
MDFYRSLLLGDTRRWGAAQFTKYKRLLGRFEHVGVELEVMGARPHSLAGGWRMCYDRITSYEIKHLFEVSHPRAMYRQVKAAVSQLHEMGIPTIGATHLNYQGSARTRYNVPFTQHHLDIEGPAALEEYMGRHEVKAVVPWYTHYELISSMLTTSCLIRQDHKDVWEIRDALYKVTKPLFDPAAVLIPLKDHFNYDPQLPPPPQREYYRNLFKNQSSPTQISEEIPILAPAVISIVDLRCMITGT